MPAEAHDDDEALGSLLLRTYLSPFGPTESSKTPAPCAEGIRVCYPPVKNLLGSIKVLLDLLDPREHLRLMT